MSFKAKDLTYDSNEPSFLRKLKSQYGDSNSDSRGARKAAFPRKARTDAEVEDDAPTIVDDVTGEDISKEEYEKFLKGTEQTDSELKEAGEQNVSALDGHERTTAAAPTIRKVEKTAGIGAGSKKRVAKTVGAGEEGGEDLQSRAQPASQADGAKKKAKAKSGKKIKLSFDDEATPG